MKVSNSAKRLGELMQILNIRQTDLVEKTGIPKSAMSMYLNGKREPRQDKLTAIAEAYNINETWLMGYDVPMERNDNINSASHLYNKLAQQGVDLSGKQSDWEVFGTIDDDTLNLLEKYIALDDIGKNHVRDAIERESDRIMKLEEAKAQIEQLKRELARQSIPKMLYTFMQHIACAGTGFYFEDIPSETIEAPYKEGADFIIGVNGDSMEPDYHDGDKLYVQKTSALSIGDVGIFTVWNECFVKELGDHGLISRNPEYDNIPENDDVRLIGRVLGKVGEQ